MSLVNTHAGAHVESTWQEKLKTASFEECKEYIAKHWHILKYLPCKFRNTKLGKELHLLAVRKCGWNIRYIPRHLRDEEVCMAAVTQCGNTLQCIPRHMRNNKDIFRKLCMAALNTVYPLTIIPSYILTPEFYLDASKYGVDLNQFPPDIITEEMIVESTSKESCLFRIRDTQLIQENRNVSLVNIRKRGCDLYFVPEHFRDYEMCKEAIMRDGYAIKFIPVDLDNHPDIEELHDLAIDNVRSTCSSYIHLIRPKYRTYERCMKILQIFPCDITRVPRELIDYEMVKTAVKYGGLCRMNYDVPEEYLDNLDLWLIAYDNSGESDRKRFRQIQKHMHPKYCQMLEYVNYRSKIASLYECIENASDNQELLSGTFFIFTPYLLSIKA